MTWNWQTSDWPVFRYRAAALEPLERRFLLKSGEFVGACKHIGPADQNTLKIELISDEAIKTSEIEGEILNRSSVQSSIIHQLGLAAAAPRARPAERGIAEMMVGLYTTFEAPLSGKVLCRWHEMLLGGDRTVGIVGGYRRHGEPMQIVSGPDYRRTVHFEAPPSSRVNAEMKVFIKWFNDTGPNGKRPLAPLARAALAHLYFVSIHPFEDGNGRIARAIAEKALAQGLGRPSLVALSYTIERGRKRYYAALEHNNKGNDVTEWMIYFASTVLEALAHTLERVEFYLAKTKFYDRLRGNLNPRQQKAVGRMFREGIDGFKGGMSAEKYIAITDASRATATRDLQDMVAKGALTRIGALRHTRYHLNLRD
jgi:Fic family protein